MARAMATAGPAKILLVDDRRANLFAMEQVLAKPGYEIVKADSGPQALSFLLRSECAVMLLDVSMPGMDGYEVARLVRGNARTRDLPIVFVTAMAHEERNVLDGYESGAIDYLVKPVRPEVLRSKVAGFVALFRARQEIRRQAELLREHELRDHRHTIAALELRALQRQQAAQQRYQSLVEGLARAIAWVLDPVTFAPRLVSPAAEGLLGLGSAWWSAAPRSFTDRLPPADRKRFLEVVGALVPGGPAGQLEHRMLGAGDRTVWFETSVRLIAGEEAGTQELHGLSADVTDSVAAREAAAFHARASGELSASLDLESTLRTAVRLPIPELADWSVLEADGSCANAPQALTAHGADGCDALAAEAALRLDLDRIRAHDAPALVAPADLFVDGADSARFLAVLRRPTRALLVPLAAHGTRLGTLCLFAGDPRRLDGERGARAVELGRRIAQALENAVLHEQTRAAVRAREEFLSVASHELRTPLTALSLQSRLLADLVRGLDGAADVREDLLRRIGSIQRQVGRLGVLTNTVLDLTRMRSARLRLERAPCDIAEVVRDVCARFEDALRADGRALEVIAPERVQGCWDRTRLEQLVTNLVANAVKHGGRGSVTVSAAREGDTAVLTVADTGPGIPSEEQGRIFDAFAQGSRAGGGGLGLGLYIARSIASAHGGEIKVESAEGRGTTFRVELPDSAAAAPSDGVSGLSADAGATAAQ